MRTTTLLRREPHHDTKSGSHDPTCQTGASGKVGLQKCTNLRTGARVWIRACKLIEVHHVSCNVNEGKEHNGPGNELVERNVLIKGYERVERGAAQERYEVSANGKQNEGHVYMEHESSGTRNCYRFLHSNHL